MAARFADPQREAIVLERLSSQLPILNTTLLGCQARRADEEARLVNHLRLLVDWRLFILLRDFLDPRPASRYPACMRHQGVTIAEIIQGVRSWRQKFPTLGV